MGSPAKDSSKSGMASSAMLAGAVGVLALPSAVLAFSAGGDPSALSKQKAGAVESLDPSPEPGRLVGPVALRSLAKGKLYPFTPAESPTRPDRSVTVAVRVDAQTISVRGSKLAAGGDPAPASVRIAPTAFALGVSRGYQNFSSELVASADSRKAELPDLSRFSIAPGSAGSNSRLNPRIVVDEKRPLGRAPRTFAGENEDQVDVGGSLRVTRNLDVTAGVRYSQERDRLSPLTDGKLDNQAVYLGTQFRF